jgi:UDP-N-acetylglucosamine/UDP-N-acetylgalactosamine diphosphorylase
MTLQELKSRWTNAGQGQVFDLSESAELLKNLERINVERVNKIFKIATAATTTKASLAPLPAQAFDSTISASKEKLKRWHDLGLKLIAENKVAVILLAGGQGTRLGSSAPKGCYDINLPSHKSLFQLQGERILRLQQVAHFTSLRKH